MKVLIVGGTGLISTAITAQLLESGHDVTHYNRGQSRSRLGVDVRRVVGDRKQFGTFEQQVRESGPYDCVIDMVCFEPAEAESLVRACRDSASHVIFCSTVDVYNKPAGTFPILENHPRGGVTDYGRKKKTCEDILMAAHSRGDIQVTTIRPAHTYGEGGVIIHSLGWGTYFVDRIRNRKPIIVHGDGSSLWVSCHIDDVAGAFVAAMGNRAAMGKSYHTPGTEWMTWDQYCATVAKAMGVALPRLVHIPSELLWDAVPEHAGAARWNFMYNNIFDTTAAATDLGFRQSITFEQGVRRTVNWLEANGRIEPWRSQPYYDKLIAAWDTSCAAVVKVMSKPETATKPAAARKPKPAKAKPKAAARKASRPSAARRIGGRKALKVKSKSAKRSKRR